MPHGRWHNSRHNCRSTLRVVGRTQKLSVPCNNKHNPNFTSQQIVVDDLPDHFLQPTRTATSLVHNSLTHQKINKHGNKNAGFKKKRGHWTFRNLYRAVGNGFVIHCTQHAATSSATMQNKKISYLKLMYQHSQSTQH